MNEPPSENDFIAALCAQLGGLPRPVIGPGDDCAIVRLGTTRALLTVDAMVENVHFRVGWARPEILGERALLINLSDIAAMGGRPTACLVNLSIRPGLTQDFHERLYRGLARAARSANVAVAGGNVTRSAELSIAITLVGKLSGRALLRSGARAGDGIFVTGTLGDAALGWRILDGKISAAGQTRKYLVNRYLLPESRVEIGERLARLRSVSAAIDISDGLLSDLGHILERSRVGAEVDVDAIPVSTPYRKLTGGDPEYALSGGEDYELLFCARENQTAASLTRRLGVPITQIGRIVPRRTGLKLIRRGHPSNGRLMRLRGWDHLAFRSDLSV